MDDVECGKALKNAFNWRSMTAWTILTPMWFTIIILSCVISGLYWGDVCLEFEAFDQWLMINGILGLILWIITTPFSIFCGNKYIRKGFCYVGGFTFFTLIGMNIATLALFAADATECTDDALGIIGILVLLLQWLFIAPAVGCIVLFFGIIEPWLAKR